MVSLSKPEPLPMQFELVDDAVLMLEPIGLGLLKPVQWWKLEEIEAKLRN